MQYTKTIVYSHQRVTGPAMRQQFKVNGFSTLSKDWRSSKQESHDGFTAALAVRRASEMAVWCNLALQLTEKKVGWSVVCIRTAFSVINQTTQQPVLVKDGHDLLSYCRLIVV